MKKTIPIIYREGSFESSLNHTFISFKQYSKEKRLNKNIIHIILQHGALEYHKRHSELINYLISHFGRSILISCMDLIGHGHSGGTRAYVDSFETYVDDFLKFSRVTLDLYFNHKVKTFFIGHSLGGTILLKTIIEKEHLLPFEVSALILSNPCIKQKLEIPKIGKKALSYLNAKGAKLRLPSLYSGKDLTSKVDLAMSFDADHLNSNFITLGMGTSILNTYEEIIGSSYYIKVPLLFLLSDNDVIVDTKSTKLFLSGVSKDLVEKEEFKGTKHDLFNEKCAKNVFDTIYKYIKLKL